MTGDAPLTREQIAAIYVDSVMNAGDYDRNGVITESEWVGTGGDLATFRRFDRNNDRLVNPAELRMGAGGNNFFSSIGKAVDHNNDGQITQREMQRGASYRLMRLQF